MRNEGPEYEGQQEEKEYRGSYNLLGIRTRVAVKQVIAVQRDLCARGLAALFLDRLRDFAVAPSSVGGNSSSLQDFSVRAPKGRN